MIDNRNLNRDKIVFAYLVDRFHACLLTLNCKVLDTCCVSDPPPAAPSGENLAAKHSFSRVPTQIQGTGKALISNLAMDTLQIRFSCLASKFWTQSPKP